MTVPDLGGGSSPLTRQHSGHPSDLGFNELSIYMCGTLCTGWGKSSRRSPHRKERHVDCPHQRSGYCPGTQLRVTSTLRQSCTCSFVTCSLDVRWLSHPRWSGARPLRAKTCASRLGVALVSSAKTHRMN